MKHGRRLEILEQVEASAVEMTALQFEPGEGGINCLLHSTFPAAAYAHECAPSHHQVGSRRGRTAMTGTVGAQTLAAWSAD